MNILGWPRFDQMNIKIYVDWGKATNMKMLNVCRQFYRNIDDSNLCVLTKTGQNILKLIMYKLVKNGQFMAKLQMKWVQQNIQTYLDDQELNEQMSEYNPMPKN